MRLRDGFRIARRDELVLGGIALIVLIGLVGGGINLLVPRQLDDNGVSAGQIGLLFTVGSAIYTVMSGAVARRGDRWATLRVGGLAALATGATVVLVLLSGSTLAAVAFIVLRAPFWSTMDTIIYPLAAAGAHRSALGRGFVMGLVMLGWGIASTLGPLDRRRAHGRLGRAGGIRLMILWCALFGGWLLRTARTTGRAECGGGRPRPPLRRPRPRQSCGPSTTASRAAYDAELLDGMGYRSPDELASVVQRLVPTNAHILDAGAGTGLLGSALAEKGFTRLDGLDLSSGMLAEAAKKRIYGDLREARLGEHLDYATDSYDAVVSGGVFTAGHAPASALDELVRLTRSGGARHLHAPLGPAAPRLRRGHRRTGAAETMGARRARRRVPGAPDRRARGARTRLGVSRPVTASRPPRSQPRGSGCRRAGFFVYSASGLSSTRVDEAPLHDPALVHHRDLLRQGADQREVVGDEQEPDVQLALQLGEHVDDRGLHRHVQGGRDLVADEQLRLRDERAGDRDALALSARQLVRVALEARGRELHALERRAHATSGVRAARSEKKCRSGCSMICAIVFRGLSEL